jgi:HEAT repeat-containing protein 5
MSDSATPNGLCENNIVTPYLELDVSKLHSLPSEQQDLFLLTFISDLVRHVRDLDNDALPAHQASIKKQLVIILNLSSPTPSRPIRDNLAIIYTEIFVRGSRSLLYEAINELVDIINAGKAEKDLKNKHAAVVCLGRILGTAGDSAASLSGLALSSLLKLLKQAQNHAGLRAAIYKALGRAVEGIQSSIDEPSARDVWKSARAAASNEKALLSQKTACYCLESLVSSTYYFDATNDLDALKTTMWRAFESPVASVRHAAASALASAFVKLFSESETHPSARQTTRGPKKVANSLDGEDEADRPSSSTSKKHVVPLSLSLHDILRTLASHYTKSSTSNRARAGVMVCYKYTLSELPEKVVEERYGVIAAHLFDDVLSHPTVRYNRHRLLLCRRMVRAILDSTIGFKLLSESAQLNATQWLLNNALKKFPQNAPDQHEPPKQAVIAALSSVSNLLSCLGPAAGPMAENCREVLFQVLQHPSYTVQIYVSHCLRALVLACPQQLLICAHDCMGRVKKNVSQLNESRLYRRRCVGYATALAAVISTSRSKPLYGSVEVFSEVLITATELLKASSGTELRVSATQVQTAWILVGGLMPLGPNFVKIHLNQLLLLWRNALPKPLTQNNATKRGSLETSFLAHVRECALGALLVFLEYNGSLITTDGSRRIATMLQNTVAFYDSIPTRQQPEEIANRLIPALQLQDLMIMVQRRLLQCFTRLISFSHLEPAGILSHSNLLSLAIASLAEPESASYQNGDSSITSSISNFESLWEVADNWGFGINGLIRGHCVEVLGRDGDRRILGDGEILPDEEDGIDNVVRFVMSLDLTLLLTLIAIVTRMQSLGTRLTTPVPSGVPRLQSGS